MTVRTRAVVGVLLAGAAALAAVAGPAVPAAAHPFGPPSSAGISADGAQVVIAWRAAEDDWVALGQSLGAFEDPVNGAVSTALTGEQKLQRSPAVRDYLLDRVAVNQAGRPCAGRLATLENLLSKGAEFTFDCPGPVVEVDVTVSVLTDLNEAYRTMLVAETAASPAQVLFTAAQTTARLTFSGSGAGTPAAVITVAIGTGAAALGGIGLFTALHLRRRARRRA